MALQRLRSLIVTAVLMMLALIMPAFSQAQSAPSPEKVDQLIQLLSDPTVKDWLAKQSSQAAQPADAAPAQPDDAMSKSMVSTGLERIREHVQRIIRAVPQLPEEFARARTITMLEFANRGLFGVFLIVATFIVAGVVLSAIIYRLTARLRQWIIKLPHTTPLGRAKRFGGRNLYATLLICAFVVGSAGAFLMFQWPPLLREIVLAYLTAAIGVWAVRAYVASTLIPTFMQIDNAEALRALPISNAAADHWFRWLLIIAVWFGLVAATLSFAPLLGFTKDGMLAMSVPTSTILLILTLLAVWLRPRDASLIPHKRKLGHTAITWLLTLFFIIFWLMRLAGLWFAMWLTIAAVGVPFLIYLAHRAVHYLLRADPADEPGSAMPAISVALIDRGIRVALIALSAYLLARAFGLGISSMQSQEHPTLNLILRALLNAAVIVLAADFGWSIIKAVIERRLGVARISGGEAAHEIDTRQMRLLTLLPIIKNMVFAVIVVMAVLMILSSIGIQIGPLIAGAGVVGVAVGFGAQTLVKDIISGIFYLLDDAFRVGEYISSGKYMGTVESFSLRSVKLRHHRGALYTIPFGELGAVQNQSRDWTTDKFNITVGYDTDIDAARKLIKKVGLQIAEDPEFAPYVIEPIKMQGVQDFGEYGVVLRLKSTRKPGQAFGMKRRFYIAIKQAFKEAGIIIPIASVHVHHDEAADDKVAATATRIRRRKAAASGGDGS
ncbi:MULTISPECIES: mechanosensitive ion channel family protein [Mesorhizobium]|nr:MULTISPECIES: mechanosensitive ion channel family protein [Mesorhizobium]